jgi:hypothetical protein
MSTTDAFDIGGGAERSAPSALERLNKFLQEAVALEEIVEQQENDLKAAKGTLHVLKTKTIPDLMTEMLLDEVVYNGWKAKINDFVSGALPSDPERRAKAIAWLEEHEGGGLIKTQVSVDFGRTQRNEALAIADSIKLAGFAPDVSSGVHSATLQAFARERIKNGEPIDTEVLGLYTGKVVKFGRVKK